jgi:iron complex outermembrane recepter protein
MYRTSSRALRRAMVFVLFPFATSVLADETVFKEVIVTASLGKSPLDVAQPTQVLGGDDLARQLASSLGETLSGQLGVSSSYFGPTASRPIIRGLGGYRVQTLQDGIASLDVGSISDDHAVTIDASLAEQIEVIKGPATLLYGSGASGGLINVVTQRVPRRGEDLFGLAEVRTSTAADERAGVFALNIQHEQIALHGDYFKTRSSDIDIPGSTISQRLRDRLIAAGEAIESHGKLPSFSDASGGAFGFSWLPTNGTIGASASRYATIYSIPGEESAFIDMQQTRYDGKAEWHASNGWLRSVSLDGAYNDYKHTEFEAPGIPGTLFTQHAFEARGAANHVHNDAWRGTFGAQVTQLDFVAEGEEAFVPASITKSVGAFVLEEFDLSNWTFSLGARFEKQAIDVRAAGLSNFDEGALSASGGAVRKISDIDSLAINVTHTGRHPQATELYANGPHIAAQRFEIGEVTLATEIANTLDVSLRRNGENVNWLLSGFYNRYRNFIFANPTGNIVDELMEVQYRQEAATLYGYEAEITFPIGVQQASDAWRLRLLSDYVRGSRQNGEPLPQMPPLKIGAGIHFEQGTWHAELEAIHSTKQTRLATNELATEAYWMANVDLSYRVESSTGDWLLFLRGTNLLDEEARQATSSLKDLVPLPGRSLAAGVRYTF